MLVVTTNDIPGFRIVRHLGLVRGLTVRSRSVVGNIGAAIQIFFGGNISVYTRLAEHTRQEAFDLLVEHAQSMGANAVIAMRYDANEIAAAVTEVLAYGSAVVIEPIADSGSAPADPGPWAPARR
ncbi:YbjQ family protein [Hyphomicrobium sp. 2TAF46]|uniref:YbjQ family protein n=1 Tax=Hyphomicrobium sp. 2TAF46 TaxID=3233019 RepID=UPI003F90E165